MPMPIRPENRITTEDPRQAKRERLEKALANPKISGLSNIAIARLLSVDESMVRRHRAIKPAVKKKVKAKKRK